METFFVTALDVKGDLLTLIWQSCSLVRIAHNIKKHRTCYCEKHELKQLIKQQDSDGKTGK